MIQHVKFIHEVCLIFKSFNDEDLNIMVMILVVECEGFREVISILLKNYYLKPGKAFVKGSCLKNY